jgi:hypothetical protein
MKYTYRVMIFSVLFTIMSIYDARAWIVFKSTISPALDMTINNALLKYQDQSKLAKGFANANAYSAHVATLRGFQGYDKFAISLGTMGAAQVPAATTDLSYYQHIAKKLTSQGDIYAGVAWNAWALNAGVKLPGDFYISARFGKLKYSYSDYDFNGTTLGAMLNYQLVKPWSPPVKIFLWRGLSIGAGYLWQSSKTAYHFSDKENIDSSTGTTLRAKIKISATSSSQVVPLELSTAIRLFWFLNIHAGGGIDFAWGTSQLRYSGIGTLLVASPPNLGLVAAYGKQSGTGPTHFLPKIFCGPGLSMGPVIVDIPFTYYFNNGFNLGVTVGVVW